MGEADIVTVRSRAELRDWLAAHHETSPGIWLATFKKHHPDCLPWGQAVEELLCWGWVDAQVSALDSDRMRHRVGPRKTTSAWSAVNKEIVARMRAEPQCCSAVLQRGAAARCCSDEETTNTTYHRCCGSYF